MSDGENKSAAALSDTEMTSDCETPGKPKKRGTVLPDSATLTPGQMALAKFITGSVRSDISEICTEVQKVAIKVGKVEADVKAQDSRIAALETEMGGLKRSVETDSRPSSASGKSSTGGAHGDCAPTLTPANHYSGDRKVDRCFLTVGGMASELSTSHHRDSMQSGDVRPSRKCQGLVGARAVRLRLQDKVLLF